MRRLAAGPGDRFLRTVTIHIRFPPEMGLSTWRELSHLFLRNNIRGDGNGSMACHPQCRDLLCPALRNPCISWRVGVPPSENAFETVLAVHRDNKFGKHVVAFVKARPLKHNCSRCDLALDTSDDISDCPRDFTTPRLPPTRSSCVCSPAEPSFAAAATWV